MRLPSLLKNIFKLQGGIFLWRTTDSIWVPYTEYLSHCSWRADKAKSLLTPATALRTPSTWGVKPPLRRMLSGPIENSAAFPLPRLHDVCRTIVLRSLIAVTTSASWGVHSLLEILYPQC